jgi:uncharacterized protein (UPF0332 family)
MDKAENVVLINIEKARKTLTSANILFDHDDLGGTINRLYYCVFYCARALLSSENIDFKRHSGVISYFRKEYIKTGILDQRLSDIIGDLFDDRMGSDYDDDFSAKKEIVEKEMEDAEFFLDKITEYLKSIGKL